MSLPHYSVFTGAQVDAALQTLGTTGTVVLGNGVSSGAVTGLGLASAPTKVWLQMHLPNASDALFLEAWPVGELTTDGFEFYLSGETNRADYQLHYHLTL